MKKVIVIFTGLLLVAIAADLSKSGYIKNGSIERDVLGGEEQEVELQLEIAQIAERYTYLLEVLPMNPTKEEAEQKFLEVRTLIEKDFTDIKTTVPLNENYLNGEVKADWSFEPFGVIASDGTVYVEKLEEEETIIQAQVDLKCGRYEERYEFSFLIEKPQLTKEEQILQEIRDWMDSQMELEGTGILQLPTEMNGVNLKWSEKKEYVTPKIFLLEVLGVILIGVLSKRKKAEEERKKLTEMEWDYSDVVNQLSLLLGAGMTTRQAWNRMAVQYSFKRKLNLCSERLVYEAILRMNRRFSEGESEKAIYQKFSEEIPAACYRKLMRILLGNLEMGTQGICVRLEEESTQAFEHKILQAKKRGEEASTKLLFPLMLMMLIVMGIVMLPALIGFQF